MSKKSAIDSFPDLPPDGHPLRLLGARLADLLDEDNWDNCEALLIEAWEELAQAKAELAELKSRENPVTRLHNICNALSNELRDSPYTEEEWRRVDCQIAELKRELAAVTAERDALRVDVEKYMELLYAVYRKWPGESRHETALRYIRERESCSCCGQGNAAREQQPGGRGE